MAIVEVIKYNGSPDVFAWKFPNENLGTWTQLIVNESQEAVLYKGGQALDIFAAGRHTLSTANIPLLNRIINLPFGGRSPFSAEVWYINKVHSLDIKWGTPAPIQLKDPKYNVFIPLRSFGQFGIQVVDSKKFLTKIVGTLPAIDRDNITTFFRGLYLTKVKDSISSYLINKGVSILEINAHLIDLSEFLREIIAPTLDEYGINLLNFFVNSINVPEDDPAVIKLKEALAKRAQMDIIGFNYQQERSFDTLEGAATNPGSGQAGMMGAGMGLGMGLGVGGAMGNQFGGLAQEINTSGSNASSAQNTVEPPKSTIKCNSCGHDCETNGKFCTECGEALGNKCPGCDAIIEKNPKFCPECGTSMLKKCSGCDATLEGNPNFCPECGNKT